MHLYFVNFRLINERHKIKRIMYNYSLTWDTNPHSSRLHTHAVNDLMLTLTLQNQTKLNSPAHNIRMLDLITQVLLKLILLDFSLFCVLLLFFSTDSSFIDNIFFIPFISRPSLLLKKKMA